MQGEGHGIAGHTNTYRTLVRCGNWVEDTFGHELAAKKAQSQSSFHSATENNTHFSHPESKQTPKGPENAGKPSMRGLERQLLLAHCEKGNLHVASGAHERYQTTHRNSFCGSDRASGQVPVPTNRARTRALKLEQESKHTGFETTYYTESKAPHSEGKRTEQDNSHRHGASRTFTKQFLQAHAFNAIQNHC